MSSNKIPSIPASVADTVRGRPGQIALIEGTSEVRVYDGSTLGGIPAIALSSDNKLPFSVLPAPVAAKPVALTPLSVTASSAILQSSDFYMQSGLEHQHTFSQWQVSNTSDFNNTVYDSGWVTDLLAHTVTGLTPLTQFYYRVRHRAASDFDGDWSDLTSFTTQIPSGEQLYTTPGTYTFTVPAGVTSVCVVCVGAGGTKYTNYLYGGTGGGLGWKNNIAVTPGQQISVVVGNGVYGSTARSSSFGAVLSATGGKNSGYESNIGGAPIGHDGGGSGGTCTTINGLDNLGGGGGAGGYTGNGGTGGSQYNNGTAGYGGGGGGGHRTAGGGGVGLYGQGANGNGGSNNGGSGGANASGASGGNYGGGGGGNGGNNTANGGNGAVRIIWGAGRSFPNNAA